MVQSEDVELYKTEWRVNVPISRFRAELRKYLDRVLQGEEIVITERGEPLARVVGIDTNPVLARLVREGILSPPVALPELEISLDDLVRPSSPVSPLISEQRD